MSVMAEPLSSPGVKSTSTWPSPAVQLSIVRVSGMPGVTVTGPLGVLGPLPLMARSSTS